MSGSRDDLDALRAELSACSRRAQALCAGRDAAELARRPDPRRWSIAEQLEHLSLTTDAYLPLIDAAAVELERAGARSEGPYRTGLLVRAMLWYLEPPYRQRVPTTPPFEPAPGLDPAAALPRFLDLQRALDQRLARLRGFALDRPKVRSPFNARLRYGLWGALRLIPCHQRRHLWSAERGFSGPRR
jgi:hypothetical protein